MLKVKATNGNTYGIDWEFFRTHLPKSNSRTIRTKAVLYRLEPTERDGKQVLARMMLGASEAYVSPKDTYNKGLGRRKALSLLLRRYSNQYLGGLFNDKSLRKQIWEEYFNKCNDLQGVKTAKAL